MFKNSGSLLLALCLLAVAALALGLLLGSYHVDLRDALARDILLNIRLPRTCNAFIVGGALALAGCLMQILLQNPLADPYVLGTSGGSACVVLLAMLLGLTGPWLGPIAFVGALSSTLLVFVLSKRRSLWQSQQLLLIGVMIATAWGALMSFMLSIADTSHLPSMLFWLMGDIHYQHIAYVSLAILLFGLAISCYQAKHLDVLAHGQEFALSLGVNQTSLEIQLFLLSSLLTASAVSIAGSIGFIGLIVPHLLRLISGGVKHRVLLPAVVLLGGSLLTIADSLARTLFHPVQLPVGIMTSLIGVPVFLYLLLREVK